MYCQNCGKEIPDAAAFCSHCGAAQNSKSDPVHRPQTANAAKAAAKPSAATGKRESSSKKKKTKGIILLALGALSVLGSFSNGFYGSMLEYGMDLADLTALAIQAALVIGGARMLSGSKKS